MIQFNGEETDVTFVFSLRVETPGAPTMTGSHSMTLNEGYEAVSTGAFTIKSDSAPSVTL